MATLRVTLFNIVFIVVSLTVAVSVLGAAGRPAAPAPAPAPDIRGSSLKADKILVLKAQRRLHLLYRGRIIRTYRIALGFAPKGHKRQDGDGRTPEGLYRITWHNPKSRFYRSLKISYPNARDREWARVRGLSPGGDIFIHGMPNGSAWLGPVHHLRDWTLGCIAVANGEMDEIWTAVADGTPIEIRP